MRKIVITGAAGLVGRNLVAKLMSRTDLDIVGIDKHAENVKLFREVHLTVEMIEADLSKPSDWSACLDGADTVVANQAQIGGLFAQDFEDNNVEATRYILAAVQTPRCLIVSGFRRPSSIHRRTISTRATRPLRNAVRRLPRCTCDAAANLDDWLV